jgi:hypothetical protein
MSNLTGDILANMMFIARLRSEIFYSQRRLVWKRIYKTPWSGTNSKPSQLRSDMAKSRDI